MKLREEEKHVGEMNHLKKKDKAQDKLTSGHFSWMTSIMSSVKSPWMIISSSAVTEAPQENFWAKNRWASLSSMSAGVNTEFMLRTKHRKREQERERERGCSEVDKNKTPDSYQMLPGHTPVSHIFSWLLGFLLSWLFEAPSSFSVWSDLSHL